MFLFNCLRPNDADLSILLSCETLLYQNVIHNSQTFTNVQKAISYMWRIASPFQTHAHLTSLAIAKHNYVYIYFWTMLIFCISLLLNCSTLHPDTLHQHTTTPNKNGFHMKHLMLNPIYLLLVMTATCTQNTLYF